jgi:hypothetical protein
MKVRTLTATLLLGGLFAIASPGTAEAAHRHSRWCDHRDYRHSRVYRPHYDRGYVYHDYGYAPRYYYDAPRYYYRPVPVYRPYVYRPYYPARRYWYPRSRFGLHLSFGF